MSNKLEIGILEAHQLFQKKPSQPRACSGNLLLRQGLECQEKKSGHGYQLIKSTFLNVFSKNVCHFLADTLRILKCPRLAL